MKFTTQIKTNICEKLENITYNLTKISFHFQCVIAQGDEGIMVLLERSYLIDIINDHRDEKVKVTVRFFNLEDLVIHTTEKTEIEINTTVNISFHVKKKKPYNKIKLNTKENPTTIPSFVKCHHYSLLRIYQKQLNETGKHCCMLQSMTLQLLHHYHLFYEQVL